MSNFVINSALTSPPLASEFIPLLVNQKLTMSGGSVLQLNFDRDPWNSRISFEPGVPVMLGGTLKLTFADDANVAAKSA